MITATISGAQLDTIDVDELAQLVTVANVVDRFEMSIRLTDSAFRLSLGAHGLAAAFIAAGQASTRVAETLTLAAPAFEDTSRYVFESQPRSNPTAPIPERVRRQNRRRW